MKIIPNFLKGDMLEYAEELFSNFPDPKYTWVKSEFVPNNHHVEYHTDVSEHSKYEPLRKYLYDNLKEIIGDDNYRLIFYGRAWESGARHIWHNDVRETNIDTIAVTIYMNKHWEIDWGGLHLYEENGDRKFYVPTYNDAIITYSPQMHAVSTIDRDADMRKTIQIFFKKIKTEECPLPEKIVSQPAHPEPLPEPVEVKPIPKTNRWMNLG